MGRAGAAALGRSRVAGVGPPPRAKMESVPQHLLLFAATTGYQIRVFADAARRLGIEFTLATDRCHVLDDPWGDRALAVKFDRIAESLDALRRAHQEVAHFDGVAAVGDQPAVLAAEAAAMLGLPFHPPAAARACRDKYLARQLYQAAGMRVPRFFRAALDDSPKTLADRAPYPCVLKPLGLSGSRGVIRANDPAEFALAFERIARIVGAERTEAERTEAERGGPEPATPQQGQRHLQIESYIPGREFAIEGLVMDGELHSLALFDKPDPLEGPFFEETIYVTPSREPAEAQQALIDTTARAVRALGLRHGPVHAELRYDGQDAWMLEAAARPIGGLCARALRFAYRGNSCPLEELILRHALGEDVSGARFEGPASGVMMIPIPQDGVYQSVEGTEHALAVPLIEDVVIAAKEGQRLRPLPEGASYLGFIFARGDSAEAVEAAMRRSHAELRFHIATALPTFRP